MIIALDKNKRPLGFLTERRCRILMERKRAVLYRVFPTVVILMDMDVRKLRDLPSYRIKIDPGSKYTGIAIVRNDTDELVYAMQIEHRGDAVRAGLQKRKMARRNRRSRETGYRRAKWGNRCLSDGDKKSYNSDRKDGWSASQYPECGR
ncbi:MAG: RRXRR domain-containing protein [Lachnospiraceae bacterium]